jgi:hypothetical protein
MTQWQRWWVRRRLVLSLSLVFVVAAFAVVTLRASTAPAPVSPSTLSPTTSSHASYLFLLAMPYGDLHPGQPVLIHWMPELLDAASPTPTTSVTCSLALYGPYSSQLALEGALHVEGVGNADPSHWPSPAFVSPLLTVNDQAHVPQPVVMLLPATLRPGFYGLASVSLHASDKTTSQTFTIVHVVSLGAGGAGKP